MTRLRNTATGTVVHCGGELETRFLQSGWVDADHAPPVEHSLPAEIEDIAEDTAGAGDGDAEEAETGQTDEPDDAPEQSVNPKRGRPRKNQ